MREKSFLLENGTIFISDGKGKSIGFMTITEFEKYTDGTSFDILDAEYIDYRPNSKVYWKDKSLLLPFKEQAMLETFISNIKLFINRKNDKYYKVTLNEAKIQKIRDIDEISIEKKFEAEKNPYDGKHIDGDYESIKEVRRCLQDYILLYTLNGGKEESQTIERLVHLTKHINDITNLAADAKNTINNMRNITKVKKFNPKTHIDWPTWEPGK